MKLLHHLHFYLRPAQPAAFLCSCMLVGCATKAPITHEVKVPVHVPCVGAVPVAPVYEFDKLTAAASDGEKVLALARDWARAKVRWQTGSGRGEVPVAFSAAGGQSISSAFRDFERILAMRAD